MHCTEEAGEWSLRRRKLCRWELRVGASVPEEISGSGSCKYLSQVPRPSQGTRLQTTPQSLPLITLHGQVNRAYEEESNEDGRTEPLPAVIIFPMLFNSKGGAKVSQSEVNNFPMRVNNKEKVMPRRWRRKSHRERKDKNELQPKLLLQTFYLYL